MQGRKTGVATWSDVRREEDRRDGFAEGCGCSLRKLGEARVGVRSSGLSCCFGQGGLMTP